MFPYRRGGKKRGKGGGPPAQGGQGAPAAGGGPRRHRDMGQGGQGGRRIAGNAHELLPQLQPTTKALAHALSNGGRLGGQIGQARGILDQAERFIDERTVDRLSPSQREEFLEQVARLKLTLADAEAAAQEQEDEEPVEQKRAAPPLSLERLRALALSIASAPSHRIEPTGPVLAEPGDTVERPPQPTTPAAPRADIPEGSPRSARLRLKSEVPPRAREGRV